MSTGLQLRQVEEMNLSELQTLGQVFTKSGFFADTKDAAQAVVKVMAGMELGFPPIASMTGVYIVKGKVSLSANLMAAAIKKSRKYNYRVRQLDGNGCKIEFFEEGESTGFSEFTRIDAQNAGLVGSDTYKKFFRNMAFARAMSNGAKWYCPDIFGGPIYTPDELGAEVDGETGEVVRLPVEVSDATFGQTLREQVQAIVDEQMEVVELEPEPEPVRAVKLEGAQPQPSTPASPRQELRALNRRLGFTDAQLLKWLTNKYGLTEGLTLGVAMDSLQPGELSQAIDLFTQKVEEAK